jgi:lipopolysaccharide transport system ATP-binding protein
MSQCLGFGSSLWERINDFRAEGMTYAIRFHNVSKYFNVRHEGPLSIQAMLHNLARFRLRQPKQKFWVLRNTSFDVEHGEMLGIIGVNGSGKSTTLKLISRIIEPTSGSVEVDGRVSALLELGAGFHPDLTGRENIYLNGSIMGLTRTEIDHKYDDIVHFADLELPIDMPVRYYSSGMYMRLGFSVAVHAEPKILLVDEVLAVGDYAFQIKCLRRIQELKQAGTTIVFVSHDMDAIQEFCDRAIWLDEGGVHVEGPPQQVVEQYLSGFSEENLEFLGEHKRRAHVQRWGTKEVELTDVRFLNREGREQPYFASGEPLCVEMHYKAHKRIKSPVFGMAFHAGDGTWINGSNTMTSGQEIDWVQGKGKVTYCIDSLPLLQGSYLFTAVVYDHSRSIPRAYDHWDKAFLLQVRNSETVRERLGMIYIPCRWQHDRAS